MSSYEVIRQSSEALRRILWQEFEKDTLIQSIVNGPQDIVLKNPTETARNSSYKLSIWLYQVCENEFLKNQPVVQGNSRDSTQFPPLSLDLSYLITPFTQTGEYDHLLLGKTMQVLYDNAILLLREPTGGPPFTITEDLRIVFCRLTLEELTRIWEALREPYRLSVCYQVRVTQIDSLRQSNQARVLDRLAGLQNGVVDLAMLPE
ncbi:MAG TPA: DUF4255 domain-containing protein [Abditibacteriaceae bacterium]